MRYRFILMFSLIFLTLFFGATSIKAIVNGTDANNPEFQAVVHLASGCTGTFVHSNFILTAAHCARQCINLSDIGCVTGTPTDVIQGLAVGIDGPVTLLTADDGKLPGTGGNEYPIDFVYFPQASDIGRSRPPDVAILRTKQAFLGQIIPVLPHQDRPQPDESNYCRRWEYTWPWVLGYSTNENTVDERRRIGRAFAECDLEKDETVFKLDGHGRANQIGIRICQGDSGGPVLWQTGFGSFAVGGINSSSDNYNVITDTRCPSERGESFEAFIPSAFLDRVAQMDSLCRGVASWEACPGVPTPYNAYKLRYLGTEIEQCGEPRLRIPSLQGNVDISTGGTSGAEVSGNRFSWYCGDSQEWTTAPTSTRFVIAKRALTDRQIIWDSYEILECSPKSNEVALYPDVGFGSRCVVKSVGDYLNSTLIGLPDNSISSIKVGMDVKATLCKDVNLGGECETFTTDNINLSNNAIGNDQVSSIRIVITPPPSIPISNELGYVAVGVSLKDKFSQAQKWQNHFCATSEICALGDVNGDKKIDIISFVKTNHGVNDSDVNVSLSTGSNFSTSQRWQDYFCTLNDICAVGDVNGDQQADVIAFTGAVVNVALSNGTNFEATQEWHNNFCTVVDQTCVVGDVNGDGKADLIAFAQDGIYVALSSGTKFNPSQKWSDFSCLNGKGCIVGDVNGDRKADIIKFLGSISGVDDSDVYVLLSIGYQFTPSQKWLDYFCTLDEICSTGDVSGDGKDDIIVFERANNFGDQGVVRVAVSSGTSFLADEPYKNVSAEAFCVLNDFCAVGDVTGDGKSDIVNFSRFNWPETTDVGNTIYPPIAAFKDKFYRFGYKSGNTILQSSSIDGRTWSDYLETPLSNVKSIQTTASSASKLCLWGYNTSDQPFTSCTSDPDAGWSSPSINNFAFAWASIDIAYFQGGFYATGLTQSNQIAISSSSDGVQWTASRFINSVDTTRNPPLIASSNDKLCVTWLTSNFTGLIAISCTDKPDSDWPSGILVSGVTKLIHTSISATFGFAYIADRFTLAWGAETDECRVAGCKMPTSMIQSVDGSNWTSVVKYNVVDGSMFYDVSQIEHTDQRVCMLTLTGITDGARFAISCRPIPLLFLTTPQNQVYLPLIVR